MKDLVIKPDQLKQLFAFLQEQPHKFSAPLVNFFQELMAEQNAPAVEDMSIAPQEIAQSEGK